AEDVSISDDAAALSQSGDRRDLRRARRGDRGPEAAGGEARDGNPRTSRNLERQPGDQDRRATRAYRELSARDDLAAVRQLRSRYALLRRARAEREDRP